MLSLIFNCVESLHVAGDEVLFIKASMKVRGFSNDMYNLGYYKEKKLKENTNLIFQPQCATQECPRAPSVQIIQITIPYLYHKLPPSLALKPTLTQLTLQQRSVTVHLS